MQHIDVAEASMLQTEVTGSTVGEEAAPPPLTPQRKCSPPSAQYPRAEGLELAQLC